jgi:hypothetical protein
MTRTMRWLVLAVIAAAFSSRAGQAATYFAASCNESAVQAAITAEQASPADGDIISIPAGTCTWTGSSGINVTFSNSVTIQGAGALYSISGGSGTAGSDATVITDNLSGGPGDFVITINSPKSFRFTGIALLQNSSSTVNSNGNLSINGTSTAVRVDHCHFYLYNGQINVQVNGSVQGVADHDYFDNLSGLLDFSLAFHNGEGWNGASADLGDASWTDTEHWGSSEFFFVEDSLFNNGDIGDAHDGGRYVVRYCTVVNTGNNGQMFNHGLAGGDRARSVRAAEFYQNTMTQLGSTGAGNNAYAANGGTLLFWGNTITQYRYAVGVDYTRKDNSTYNYGTTPGNWGNCSTNTSTGWDQSASPPSGYACLDQPARGAGDLLSGNFPTVCDQTQGCSTYSGQWPRQALSPVYIWDNTFTPAVGYSPVGLVSNASTCATCSTALLSDNQDYYQQFGTYGESGSFNGTKGVGQGLLSARSSTCTAGPGGNTPGVGYWATDQNTLYVCNPTNTWTAYYTPYTYPHPLATSGTAPSPPTNLQATPH